LSALKKFGKLNICVYFDVILLNITILADKK